MRHYEIMLLVHPDQSEQVPGMIQRYVTTVTEQNGKIHRQEDLGRRALAYSIGKISKAHYVLLNVECNGETLKDLDKGFRFNDAVIRYLIEKKTRAETGPSVLLKAKETKED